VASESGTAQTRGIYPFGVEGLWYRSVEGRRTAWESRPKKVTALFPKPRTPLRVSWVAPDTWNPVWIHADHCVRLNTRCRPIVKSTARERWKAPLLGEWNRTWNLWLTSGRSPRVGWRRTFCIMGLGVYVGGEPKSLRDGGAAKASLNRAHSFRHNTRSGGDLPMTRLKPR